MNCTFERLMIIITLWSIFQDWAAAMNLWAEDWQVKLWQTSREESPSALLSVKILRQTYSKSCWRLTPGGTFLDAPSMWDSAVLLTLMIHCFINLITTPSLMQATPDSMEAQLDNGLIIGHAYSITDVRYVSQVLILHAKHLLVYKWF